jgi:hypothetical protein
MRYRFILLLILALLPCKSLAVDLKTISAEEYVAQNPSKERRAIVDFITHQFDDWRKSGVSQVQLDKLYSDQTAALAFHLHRFQIVDGILYADSYNTKDPRLENGGYFVEVTQYLQKLLESYKINDVDFIVHGEDMIQVLGGLEKKILRFPAFMMSKNLKSDCEKDKFLLPDAFLMEDKWRALISDIERANEAWPWDGKLDKIFWRGMTTGWSLDEPGDKNGVHRSDYVVESLGDGNQYNIQQLGKLPRLNLVMLSSIYPELINAKFTERPFDFHTMHLINARIVRYPFPNISRNQSGLALMDILSKIKARSANIPEIDHLRYKYLMSIDGHSSAWRRVPWIMLSNSVLVKQEAPTTQWFYSAMKPHEHYVPVNERLTDIFEQIDWMKVNDEKVHKISKNAQKLVRENLMPEDIEKQMVIILNEYHKLHKGAKIVPTLPRGDSYKAIRASRQ